MYEWNGVSWIIKDSLIYQVSDYYDSIFGVQTSLSSDGNTLAVGAWQDSSTATGSREGSANIFKYSNGEWNHVPPTIWGNSGNYAGKVVLSGSGNYLINGHPSESEAKCFDLRFSHSVPIYEFSGPPLQNEFHAFV